MVANKILNSIGFIVLVYIWLFTAINVMSLPKNIPLHFNLDGRPDSYGNRFWILALPVVATGIFYCMKYVAKQKEAKMIKESSAMNHNRQITNRFVKIILIYILLFIADIATESILVANGYYTRLSSISTVLVVLLMLTIVGYFIYAKNKIHEIH